MSANADANANANGYSDRNCYGNSNGNRDGHGNCHCHCNGNCHGYSNSNRDGYAADSSYADAEAAPDAAAAALTGKLTRIVKAGTRETNSRVPCFLAEKD